MLVRSRSSRYRPAMTYQEYVDLTQQVSAAVDAKDYDAALALLNNILKADLPDLDKSYMSINVGVVWDKRGDPIEALRWYDRAIQLEKPYHRIFAQQEKAAYLLRLQRNEEALRIFRDLVQKPFLVFSEKEKLSEMIRQLGG